MPPSQLKTTQYNQPLRRPPSQDNETGKKTSYHTYIAFAERQLGGPITQLIAMLQGGLLCTAIDQANAYYT